MAINALKDIAWIPTARGRMTARDVLCSSATVPNNSSRNTLSTQDLLINPGFSAGSSLRILRDIAVLAERIRKQKGSKVAPEEPDIDAIDEAIESLAPYCNPLNADYPFLQRQVISGQETDGAPKKLSPAMAPDSAEAFWKMSFTFANQLSLDKALLWLAINHHYSLAGNNQYDGEKCAMGAPGIRFLGVDKKKDVGKTITEVFFIKDSIYETLLMNIPIDWLECNDFPAWALRNPESLGKDHPLWDASWSSNTAVCVWEGNMLTSAKPCGIPRHWYSQAHGVCPSAKKDKAAKEQENARKKSWWDNRNTRDPLYLYTPNKDGILKPQRLDFGRDATDLAVHWNAEQNPQYMEYSSTTRILHHDAESYLCFLRHQLGGTPSSPVIRASEVLIPDDNSLWSPHKDLYEIAEMYANVVLDMQKKLVFCFGKPTQPNIPTLSNLGFLRGDVSTAFWRHIRPIFENSMRENQLEDENNYSEILKATQKATMSAFDEVTLPYAQSMVPEVTTTHQYLREKLGKIVNVALEGMK
ncbi:type I-E CRISPR-associated protein Cse1/CasA [Mobiluncus mulieris]|uniref:type I-E CRISPR-associated protein Cse1/CasA n=1 Tax=Mobiluncus mulieris TaxID=2052 RepID=UPI00019F84E0|nr:type I-E CRISPR-associated protein Cse1/CasA [Mobiluncus mulieris]EEJ54449.1 hypothetical protein HMPREF0577_0566 [Mobiluncus mulieris ATCC 35243]MCV0001443.1 type I-E CRISPR-associated protein Cse1/CasA [Mobiluncus mulieris]SPX76222.1 Uncharacterised protein [Mobiluncus mulieris]